MESAAITAVITMTVAPDGATDLVASDLTSTRPGLIQAAPAAAIGRIDPQLFFPDQDEGPIRLSIVAVTQPGAAGVGTGQLDIETINGNTLETVGDLEAAAQVITRATNMLGIVPPGAELVIASDQINIELVLVMQKLPRTAELAV